MRRLLLSSSALVVGLAAVVAAGAPAVADSASPATCLSDCTAVFDTAGAAQFTAPATATSLTVTVDGAAGAPNPGALRLFPQAVGGAGGSATIDLGADFTGADFDLVVGGTGGGSSVSSDGELLAIAGGGGGGGYVGRLDLRDNGQLDQIFADYPGGVGGSPAVSGVSAGSPGTAYGANPANGQGATTDPGDGGAGIAPGTAGSPADGTGPVDGGAGGSRDIVADGTPTTHTGGAGGGGYAGGGGGAVTQVDAGDDNTNDLVAPGGGGSAFLAPGLTATAGEPNAGTGSVTFTWSFSPTASTTSTTVRPGDSVTITIGGLPANVAFTEVLDGQTVVSDGMSDAEGAATVTFTVPATQRAGSFPVQTVVGGVLAASTSALTVVVDAAAPSGSTPPAALAATGSDLPLGGMSAAALLIAAGALLLTMRRRVAAARSSR